MDGYRAAVPPRLSGWDEPARIHHEPRPGQWQRIIVDRGQDVEAVPVTGNHPADTVCEGWSAGGFTVRLASSRGDAHRHDGRPRQDHAVATVHPGTGALLLAVFDGVSAAPYAHIGADVAAKATLTGLRYAVEASSIVDWTAVFGRAADALLRHATYGQQPGETPVDVERRLATTVVAAVVDATAAGPRVQVARIGDSAAWYLRGTGFQPIFAGKFSGVTTSSAVEPLPRVPARIESAELSLGPDGVLLLGTDGIGDPLGDGTGLVGRLLGANLATPPPPLGFAHLVDFGRETFDDDRTLIAVWPGRSR
ncbi:MAG: SpoIIE family protein phosphatase [Catenulispora sp.]|nr:SpoIIE family protein phosphatase [Catenulispora sp.]